MSLCLGPETPEGQVTLFLQGLPFILVLGLLEALFPGLGSSIVVTIMTLGLITIPFSPC